MHDNISLSIEVVTERNKARALFKAFILGKRITGDWSCEDQQDHVMALVYGKMKKQ